MGRCYGNLVNRIDENKNFNKDKLIHVGDDITMYHWSDRDCFYVTEVINQKHIKILPYHVCADQDKKLGMGHQEWLYFKTRKELNKYLHKYHRDREFYNEEDEPIELKYRYNKWFKVHRYTKEDLDSVNMFGEKLRNAFFTKKEVDRLENNKDVCRYSAFGNISFGVKDHYYDWEF